MAHFNQKTINLKKCTTEISEVVAEDMEPMEQRNLKREGSLTARKMKSSENVFSLKSLCSPVRAPFGGYGRVETDRNSSPFRIEGKAESKKGSFITGQLFSQSNSVAHLHRKRANFNSQIHNFKKPLKSKNSPKMKKSLKGKNSFKGKNSTKSIVAKNPEIFKTDISLRLINKDFFEEGSCIMIKHIERSVFLLILENGYMMRDDLNSNKNFELDPVKTSNWGIIDIEVDSSKKVWVSTSKGLLIYDINLKFKNQILTKEVEQDPTFLKPGLKTLTISPDKSTIYWLVNSSKVASIDTQTTQILTILDKQVIGHDIHHLKILTKKYLLTLNSQKDFFKLCNLAKLRKEGGIKLKDPKTSQSSICLHYDVTKKGSRMVIGGQSSSGTKFLGVIKITQSGFIQKSQSYALKELRMVRLVEEDFEPKSHPYVFVASASGIHVFGLEKYELVWVRTLKSVCSGGILSLFYGRRLVVFGSDDQAASFYVGESGGERKGVGLG